MVIALNVARTIAVAVFAFMAMLTSAQEDNMTTFWCTLALIAALV